MEKVVVFGSGGHSKVVIDIIEKSNEYSILGLIDSHRKKGSIVHGYKVLGDESKLIEYENQIHGGIVAIGDNFVRSKVVSAIIKKSPEFNFIIAIHPNSVIGNGVKIGAGTVIMAGTVINSESSIGKHCIINTKSSMDHDCQIGDFASIAPGVTMGGTVKVGNYSTVSLGANVSHKRIIGDHTVVGAGSTVITDIDSFVIAYGTPAKTIRKRSIGEKYL
ncbi:acetyltransferase [Peribacillus sp. NPDC055009]